MGRAVMVQEEKADDCKVDGKLELAEEVMGGIWQWSRGMELRREEQVLAEVTQTSSLGLRTLKAEWQPSGAGKGQSAREHGAEERREPELLT